MINNRNMIKNLICGAGRDRTDDLLNAIQALSQLSYGPETFTSDEIGSPPFRERGN